MTSGQFHLVPIDHITVNRDRRQRRELVAIDDLADSIRRLGLIHPIVITRELELVAGERRLAAIRMLKWPNVAAQYTDELDIPTLLAIELEENVKRLDIPWQDQAMALHDYHQLRTSQEPGWTASATAEAVGLTKGHVSKMLQVAAELVSGNKMIVEAPKLSTAYGIVERAQERKDAQVLKGLKETIGVSHDPAGAEHQESILTTDFREWVHVHQAPRFNFLHCDFPYGIGADSFNQGGAPSHGGYIDTQETWFKLMETLGKATNLVCAPSCHLMFWFAMRKGDRRLYEPTALALERMGWDINPMPLIWMKSDGSGIIPDPERGPRQIYETCLFGSRGDRKITRAVANAYAAPTVRDRHMSEKPEPMLRHFFQMFVDEHTVMLDPTCGSGSALRAAESLSAKFVLGLEINGEFADRAREALERSRRLKKAEELVS